MLPAPTAPLRVAILSWRDSSHPEGGGSELYGEAMAAGLAARGHQVTILTARHPGSTPTEERDGYLIRRAGGRFTVYLRTLLRIVVGRRFDVIVDTQNGTPFFARLVTRRPVVILCHHVHREQWGIVFGPSLRGRTVARIGWWLESWLAPRVQRNCRYVTVSDVSRRDLIGLGVRAGNITVVHNGTPPSLPGVERSPVPEVVVLGRVVPHKRVEHAVRAVAQLPGVRLTIVGHGWWSATVAAEVARLGVEDRVELVGHVDEARKHELLSRAWVLATPSVMEGWGLCVVEAASHGTPSVAYRSAGGLAESVVHGSTGLLAEDSEEEFTAALRELLTSSERRREMGELARTHAEHFTREASVRAFNTVLLSVSGRLEEVRLPVLDLLPQPRQALDDASIATLG